MMKGFLRVLLPALFLLPSNGSVETRFAVEMISRNSDWRHAAAVDINNRGDLAGQGTFMTSSYIRAFFKSATSFTALPALDPALWVAPSRLNEAGQIVGDADAGYSGSYAYGHAFLWSNGETIDLGTLGGLRSWASAINDAGEVVGTSMVQNAYWTRAFIWKDGVMSELPASGKTDSSSAYDINNFGSIVGQSGSWYPHAVLWQGGVLVDLGTLPRHVKSVAKSINDDGDVVGASMTEYDAKTAVIWRNGGITSLGYLPGGYSSEALDNNGQGQIVGTAATGTYATARAVLWTAAGQIADLNELLLDNSRLKLERAASINDKGEIVAMGQYTVDATTIDAGTGVILRPVTLVSVDVRPGSEDNTIDIRRNSSVPVAVLGTAELNVRDVDRTTVRFAGAPPVRSSFVDVNHDGRRDVLFHFRTGQMRLDTLDKKGVLVGKTRAKIGVGGSDTIRVITK